MALKNPYVPKTDLGAFIEASEDIISWSGHSKNMRTGGKGHMQRACSQPAGDFNITSFQLYPEQADYDPRTCRKYISVLYNASVAVWDSHTQSLVEPITISGLTGDRAFHATGVQVNQNDDMLALLLSAGATFNSRGANVSGSDYLVVWDLKDNKERFRLDLAATPDQGHRGFQDIEHDEDGNIFAVSSYGGSLIRVSATDQKVEKWWVSKESAPAAGLSGVAKLGETTLIVADGSAKQLFRHSMREDGKNRREKVRLSSKSHVSASLTSELDGVYFPPKHEQKCLLVTDNDNGTLVIRSDDGWESAELRGTIPNQFAAPLPPETIRGFTVATVQIGDRIFAVVEWFMDGGIDAQGVVLAGNRTVFPMIDITEDVGRLCESPAARVPYIRPGLYV